MFVKKFTTSPAVKGDEDITNRLRKFFKKKETVFSESDYQESKVFNGI